MSLPEPQKRRSRREERREETRAELIAAATQAFASRGIYGASLEQIAADAGYSTGAIYWHFKSKEDLFLAVFEDYARTRVGELTEIYERGDPPRTSADQWMARSAADPSSLVLAMEFTVYAWRNPALLAQLADRMAAVRLAVGRFLEQQGALDGIELPLSAQGIGTVLRELGVGLAFAKLIDHDAFPDELFGDFVELFFELLAESPRARVTEAEEHAGE
jgi:AcrR family transcriptional regulator